MNDAERKALRKVMKEAEEYMLPMCTAVENPGQSNIVDYLKQEMASTSYEMDPTRRLFAATYRLLKEAGMSDKNVVNAINIVDQEFSDRIAEFWADTLLSAEVPPEYEDIDTLGDLLRQLSVLRFGSKKLMSQSLRVAK